LSSEPDTFKRSKKLYSSAGHSYHDPMVRFISFLIAIVAMTGIVPAKEHFFRALAEKSADAAEVLVIYSTVDIEIARPLLAAFQKRERQMAIRYHDIQTLELYDRVVRETRTHNATADFLLSSAMDLQMKLANDGFAAGWSDPEIDQIPRWARWRNEAFGITFEPAVIIYNKAYFPPGSVPHTRADLMSVLEKRDPSLFGRVATYDAARSGLGFLFLARDAEHHKDVWRFYRLLGENGAKLYSRSQAIIDRVASGRFVLGYNLLGSYAAAHAARDDRLGVVVPTDFTVVMSRIAIIPKAARNPQLGARFLSFILSRDGQEIVAGPMHMNAVTMRLSGPSTARALRAKLGAALRPIRVGPGLLVYLDQAKRQRLLKRWNAALSGN